MMLACRTCPWLAQLLHAGTSLLHFVLPDGGRGVTSNELTLTRVE